MNTLHRARGANGGGSLSTLLSLPHRRQRPPVVQWRGVCDCGWTDTVLRTREDALREVARHQAAVWCARDGRAKKDAHTRGTEA